MDKSSVSRLNAKRRSASKGLGRVMLPQVVLTKTDKVELTKTMTAGNTRLLRLAAEAKALYVPKSSTDRFSRAKFRGALFRAVDLTAGEDGVRDLRVMGVPVPADDLELILRVRSVEYRLLCGHSALIAKFARTWHLRAKSGGSRSVGLKDLYNEGCMRAMDCVYGFVLGRNAKQFSTYLTTAIDNQMMKVVNRLKPLSGWSNGDQTLFGRFERKARSVNGPVDFDELCTLLELTPDQRHSVEAMTRHVFGQADVRAKTEGGDVVDLISLAEAEEPSLDQATATAVREAVTTADLDEWERKVVDAFLAAPQGSEGWKAEVARNTINPLTGKPYSRPAPAIAMRRALKKIAQKYAGEPVVHDAA